MEVAQVSVLGSSLIVPATPTHSELMYLPSIDLFWREDHYNQRIIFYHVDLDDYRSAVDCLKGSLSRALVHFYPWAGRLAMDRDGRVAVDCNDRGVEFVEARIDIPFAHLEKADFELKTGFHKLTQRNDPPGEEVFDIPLLYIQVTQFLNGGMALSYAQSHVIADGHSMWHFMKSWAECGRGLPISMPPLNRRTIFKIDNPSGERASQLMSRGRGNAEKGVNKAEIQVKPRDLVQRLFHFSAEMIKKLKRIAGEEGKGDFTSYEVLCAHFWKRVTIARKLKKNTRVHFTVLVNHRGRLTGPVPPAYFGNVVQFGSALTFAGQLEEESLATTASRIHKAVAACTEDSLWTVMHWLELNDNSFREFLSQPGERIVMLVASSPRFPVYEVDFGWGKPAAVRAANVRGDGEMVLFAGREGGGSVDICMPLTADSMERLLEDTQFLNF